MPINTLAEIEAMSQAKAAEDNRAYLMRNGFSPDGLSYSVENDANKLWGQAMAEYDARVKNPKYLEGSYNPALVHQPKDVTPQELAAELFTPLQARFGYPGKSASPAMHITTTPQGIFGINPTDGSVKPLVEFNDKTPQAKDAVLNADYALKELDKAQASFSGVEGKLNNPDLSDEEIAHKRGEISALKDEIQSNKRTFFTTNTLDKVLAPIRPGYVRQESQPVQTNAPVVIKSSAGNTYKLHR